MGTRYSSFLNFCLIGVKLDAMGFGMTLAKIWPQKNVFIEPNAYALSQKLDSIKNSRALFG